MSEIIYLASPYTHEDLGVREERARKVSKIAGHLIHHGHNVFCPIAHSHKVSEHSVADHNEHDMWMRVDISMLNRCTDLYVLTLEGWEESKGVKEEIDFARRQGMPIYHIDEAGRRTQVEQGKDRSYRLWQTEFYDVLDVLEFGAKKYGDNNWLKPNGIKSSRTQMYDSTFHHLAESYAGMEKDHESGLDPILHAICRLMMIYTRKQRGLIGEESE